MAIDHAQSIKSYFHYLNLHLMIQEVQKNMRFERRLLDC